MLTVEAFCPAPNGTISISAGTGSATGTLNASIAQNITVRVFNAGPSTAFVEFGPASTVAITTSSIPVASGATAFFNVGQAACAAAIVASATATVYFTKGYGLGT